MGEGTAVTTQAGGEGVIFIEEDVVKHGTNICYSDKNVFIIGRSEGAGRNMFTHRDKKGGRQGQKEKEAKHLVQEW